MDGTEGKERRDRLARLNLERMQQPPAEGWKALVGRVHDKWERFSAFAGWEKAVFVAGVVVAVVAVVGIAGLLVRNATSGGGERAPSASLPDTRPSASPTAPRATPTTIVVIAPTFSPLTPTAEPNRADCAAITGTEYLSEAEHQWFLANCSPTPEPTAPFRSNEPPTAGSNPTATPIPPSFGTSDAIALAADWISHNTQYLTPTGACTAVGAGGHWVVSCHGYPPGCDLAGCEATVSVCVFADPPRVISSTHC